MRDSESARLRKRFLAPTGAQEMQMYVRLSVCLFNENSLNILLLYFLKLSFNDIAG